MYLFIFVEHFVQQFFMKNYIQNTYFYVKFSLKINQGLYISLRCEHFKQEKCFNLFRLFNSNNCGGKLNYSIYHILQRVPTTP